MGICIAYMGKLRDPSLVPAFVSDLDARAEAAGWRRQAMEVLLADQLVSCPGLRGLTLYPHPACEPLHFHFDDEGTFVNHTCMNLLGGSELGSMIRQAFAESMTLVQGVAASPKQKKKARGGGKGLVASLGVPGMPAVLGDDFLRDGARYNFVRTQGAGPEVHAAVCALLRYVKERYAPELEIKDDSGFFEDGDRAKLEAQLAHGDRMRSVAAEAVQAAAASSEGPMSLEAFIERLDEELAGADRKLH